MSENADRKWFAKHFPTAHARQKADEAVDQLNPKEKMTTYIDCWIAAYIEAGGKTSIKFKV